MKPNRIELHPRPASDFDTTTAWRVMAIADVDAELKRIEHALGGATKLRPSDIDMDEGEWHALITSLMADLPQSESDIATAAPASSTACDALLSHVAQARRALKYVASAVPAGASPTATVLLPATWAARFEMLIGCGELPAAWLLRYDVRQF